MTKQALNFAEYKSAKEALAALLELGMPMRKSPPILARLIFAYALGAISYKMGGAEDCIENMLDYPAAASDDEIAAIVADVEEDE